MPTLSIAEFAGDPPNGAVPVPALPPLAEQAVEFTGEPGKSAEFTASTTIVRVMADAYCAIRAGDTAGLTDQCLRLAPFRPEFFTVQPLWRLTVMEVGAPPEPVAEPAPEPKATKRARKKPAKRRR